MTSLRYRMISAGGNCVTFVTRLAHDTIAGRVRRRTRIGRLPADVAQAVRAFVSSYSGIERRATPRESGIIAVTLWNSWFGVAALRYKRISALKKSRYVRNVRAFGLRCDESKVLGPEIDG